MHDLCACYFLFEVWKAALLIIFYYTYLLKRDELSYTLRELFSQAPDLHLSDTPQRVIAFKQLRETAVTI